ncbi:MAG: hypothetical protein M4579_003718 [Chaenotheca gracillima]|nr:MAG: hypothetical protein M4579_003718 [Chaenotheca gracillima]
MSEHQFTTSNSFTQNVYRDVYPAVDPSSKELSQAGKVIVITGSSSGLGRPGFAVSFAKANPRALVLTARNPASHKETEAAIRAVNKTVEILPLSIDILDEASVKSGFAQIKQRFGTVDVLVHNAGLFGSDGMTLKDAPLEPWWRDIEANVKGYMLVTKHFLQLLGSEKHGTIISLTSAAGTFVMPGISAYSISKMAGTKLTAFTAAENPNVTAISLSPGIVLTSMTTPTFRPFAKDTPELVGGVAVWSATDAAKFMNGRYLSANWDVKELEQMQAEIVKKDVLKFSLSGEFGNAVLRTV